jgi:hypothetical protein
MSLRIGAEDQSAGDPRNHGLCIVLYNTSKHAQHSFDRDRRAIDYQTMRPRGPQCKSTQQRAREYSIVRFFCLDVSGVTPNSPYLAATSLIVLPGNLG